MTCLQVCVQDFCEELEYWALDDLHLEPCCQHTYYRARYVKMSRCHALVMISAVCRWLLPQKDDEGEAEEDFGTSSCASTQRHLWNLFENPHHSRAAKVSLTTSGVIYIHDLQCVLLNSEMQG